MQRLKEQLTEKINFDDEKTSITQEFSEPQNENNLVVFRGNNTQSYVPDFAITIIEAKQRIEMLQNFVKEMMIPEIDFGLIPGCKKPSLFKSGAEKLCDIFGFSKHIEVINRIEDWDNGIFHYEIKSTLKNKRTGLVEAEGLGSCNNKEKKYSEQNPFNIINTILKMAKKRSIIDAVLSATRSSALFTQDVVDLDLDKSNSKSSSNSPKEASENQLKLIRKLVTEKKIAIQDIKSILSEKYKVKESKYLTSFQASDLINRILGFSEGLDPN